MHSTLILYPMFALVVLTFAVGIMLQRARVRAVGEGLNPGYFKHNRGDRLPDYLTQISQNYENLFEMPVLFYTGVLLAYATQTVDVWVLVLAWLFAALRYAHSYVHIHINRILLRAKVFMLGSYTLALMWVILISRIVVSN